MSETPRNETERDARLAALYRAAADDRPPPALDDAIRAAARRAVVSKPWLAGAPFSRSWRISLSIAAVLVLSVSLVTLMREEAPEIAQAPGAGLPQQSAADRLSAESAPGAAEQIPVAPKTLGPGGQKPSGIGLKTPPSSFSGLGLRRDTESGASVKLRKEAAEGDHLESTISNQPPGKRAAPDAFPAAATTRDNKIAAAVEQSRQMAKERARSDIAATNDAQRLPAEEKMQLGSEAQNAVREPERTRAAVAPVPPAAKPAPAPLANAPPDDNARPKQEARGAQGFLGQPSPSPSAPVSKPFPAPMAKPAAASPLTPSAENKPVPQMAGDIRANAGLAPEKWLERIVELRKQGRFEEARANLTEFRKRYPDYSLPVFLKDGIQP